MHAFQKLFYEPVNCIIILVLFIVFIKNKGYKYPMLLALFITNILVTFSSVFYDFPFFEASTVVLKLISAIILFLYVFPKQKDMKTNSMDIFTYIYLIVINAYLGYCLIVMVSPHLKNSFIDEVLYFYTIIFILLGISAFRYFLKGNIGAKSFAVLVFFLILSDIMGTIAYYLAIFPLFHIERLFYILGFSYLIIHTTVLEQSKISSKQDN